MELRKLQKLSLLAIAVFFVFSWILPNHYVPWRSAYQEFFSFLSCLILLFVSTFFNRPKITLGIVVFFGLACVPLIQVISGKIYFSGDAWIASIYLFGFFFILFASYNLSLPLLSRYFLAQVLAGAFIIGAMLSLWIALRQWALLPSNIWVADLPLGGRPFANLAQPNSFATLLCMGLAGVLYFYEKRCLGRFVAGLLAAFLIFGIALSQSRTPWVSALLIVIFWGWKSSVYTSRFSTRALFAWLGIYILCIFLLPMLADSLLLSTSDPLGRAQSLERWDLWVQLWQAVLQGPVWGYGWSQVSLAQVDISLNHPVPLMTEHSHNVLLDLLLWNGPLLGGISILCISAWLLCLGCKARSAESLFGLIAVGFVLVHGMLEYPLEYAFFLFPVGLLLGMVAAEQYPAYEIELPRWPLSIIFLLGIFLFGWVWREYRIVEEDYRLMRFETARIGNLKAGHAAPDVILLTQLRELIRFARTEAREDMDTSELEWMRKVAHRYPYPSSLFRYALALGLNGDAQEAYKQMMILRSLHKIEFYEESVEAVRQMQKRYPQLGSLVERLEG